MGFGGDEKMRLGGEGYMSGVESFWNDRSFRAAVITEEKRKAEATAKMGESIAKTNMQPSAGPVGANPSEPGEYPAIQTNTLYQNIHSELYYASPKEVVARYGVYGRYARQTPEDGIVPVGVYAAMLELGISVAARPWLTMTQEELKQRGWVT